MSVGIAMALGVSAYDAAYLEPCLRRGLPLATFDAELANVARHRGVPLLI